MARFSDFKTSVLHGLDCEFHWELAMPRAPLFGRSVLIAHRMMPQCGMVRYFFTADILPEIPGEYPQSCDGSYAWSPTMRPLYYRVTWLARTFAQLKRDVKKKHLSTTLLHNTSPQLLHNTRSPHLSTTLHHNTSPQHSFTTLLQNTSTTLLQNTPSQHSFRTPLQHFTTTLLHNTPSEQLYNISPHTHFPTTL